MPILPASDSHDSFFKQAFGQQDYARSFLLSTLPTDIAQCLNLSVLEPSPASFVDENLRQAHSDLLFRTQFADGSDAAVYLLFAAQECSRSNDRLSNAQVHSENQRTTIERPT